jgi:hypothetical protein
VSVRAKLDLPSLEKKKFKSYFVLNFLGVVRQISPENNVTRAQLIRQKSDETKPSGRLKYELKKRVNTRMLPRRSRQQLA